MFCHLTFFVLLFLSVSSRQDPELNYTHLVTLRVGVRAHENKPKEEFGTILLGLRGDVVPITVQRFVDMCNGVDYYGERRSYENTRFHRVVKEFVIQGGGYIGDKVIPVPSFDDENFILKHHPHVIAMANSGPNTNTSQFYITTKETQWLDNKHVVFGEVVNKESKTTVQKVEAHTTDPKNIETDARILSCEVTEQR